ncbi:MAG: hypothetical protein WC556_09465 [Candidatus Methanoperedens sp.]
MSKMIRISDDVYEELSKKGTVKNSYDDVLRGLLNMQQKPESIVDNYRRKFEMHYSTNEVDEIFDTMRAIHMGVKNESDLDDSQIKSINALVQYNLVKRFKDKGYYHLWISEEGTKLASQLVVQYIDDNIDTLNKILTKYSNKIIGCALYALLADSRGYMPTMPTLYKPIGFNSRDEPFVNEKIIDNMNAFFQELVNAKFAIKSISRYSSGEPNMFGDVIHTCEEVMIKIDEIANKPVKSIGKAIVTYRVLRTIEQFYKENQNRMPRTQLNNLMGRHNSSIDGIKRYLELANKYGYTSKLNDDDPIILVLDMNKLINETFTQISMFILDESYRTDLILDNLYGMKILANIDKFGRS